MTLRVAIVHYHLRSAGVTRVIQRSVDALKERGAVPAVLAGEEPTAKFVPECPFAAMECLQYDACLDSWPPERILSEMEEKARHLLGGAPDLWHIHNHSLGKNLTLPLLVRSLADKGARVLLHIHDFAEDGRPANYAKLRKGLAELDRPFDETLYPSAGNVHYALLNNRDYDFLKQAGMDDNRLHLLQNPVSEMQALDPVDTHPPLYLYISTGIRRKNIGEMLLMAALAEGEGAFAITQSPSNPEARDIYDGWTAFAASQNLPVQFDFSTLIPGSALEDVTQPSRACISTSIAEGFGLTFLEPWLMNRPMLGRDLPDITRDFKRQGLSLDHLYDRLPVPLEWVGEASLKETLRLHYGKTLESYGQQPTPERMEAVFQDFFGDGQVDFGRLDEALQKKVIVRLSQDPAERARLREMVFPDLARVDGVIRQNRETILKNFHIANYGQTLMDIYETTCSSPAEDERPLTAEKLLMEFIAPKRFNLLRT